MVLERARPGVEDGQDAERAADPGAILREGLHGRGGLAEERGVDERLVRARDGAEWMRPGEGEEVVVASQEARPQAFEPLLGAIRLALRAVAVATRVVRVVERPAVVTAVERAAEGRGATGDDVAHRPVVRGQLLLGVRQRIGRARCLEDVRELHHLATAVSDGVCGGWFASRHQAVDGLERAVAEFPREMGVDRGGLGAGVPEVILDEAERHARFEEVRGGAVAELWRSCGGACGRGPVYGRRSS
jgi:hypothetical protein